MTVNITIYLTMLLCGSVTLYIINSFLSSRLQNKLSQGDQSIGVSLVKFSSFIAGAILVHEMLVPFQTLSKVLPVTNAGASLESNAFLFFSLFLAIVIISAFCILLVAYLLCTLLCKGRNIYVETANGNMPIILLYSAIVICLALISIGALSSVLDAFIPYPTMPVYR